MGRYYNRTKGPLAVTLGEGRAAVLAPKQWVTIDPADEGSPGILRAVAKGDLFRAAVRADPPPPTPSPTPIKVKAKVSAPVAVSSEKGPEETTEAMDAEGENEEATVPGFSEEGVSSPKPSRGRRKVSH